MSEAPAVLEVPAAPAAPAAPAVDPNAPAVSAEPEAPAKQETEEQQRSRQWRRLDRWRQRAIAAEAEARLLREQGRPPQAPAQPVAQPVDDAPKREQYETYEQYIEARAEYRADKRAAETTRKAIEEARKSETEGRTREGQEKAVREWNRKLEAARDEIPDFDEVCAESEAPVTEAMAAAIRESDRPGHLVHHLAKNPKEAERIAALSPARQAAEIVKLEDKLAKPAKRPSNAPAPIEPVAVGTAAATTLSTLDPEAAKKLSTSEWIRRDREREMAKNR